MRGEDGGYRSAVIRTGREQETKTGTKRVANNTVEMDYDCDRARHIYPERLTIGPSPDLRSWHGMKGTQSSVMASTTTTSPVIVITGTPGTGKSTHAELLVQESPFPLRHINVSEFVKEKELYENFDAEWDTYIVDEDKARVCTIRRLDRSG